MTTNANVTVTRNANNEIVLNDNGVVTVLELKTDKKGIEFFRLPENSSGWKTLQLSTLNKHDFNMVLEQKSPRVVSGTSKKTIRDWLSPEDQLVYDELIKKAEAAKEAAKAKPMTEIEKLQAKIARDQARLATLTNKASE